LHLTAGNSPDGRALVRIPEIQGLTKRKPKSAITLINFKRFEHLNMPNETNRLEPAEPVTTDSQPSIAYICRLPNELLSLIFTFLFLMPTAGIPIRYYETITLYVKPAVGLRWVCSWFRKVISHHPYWLQDHFDVIEFLPRFYNYPLGPKTSLGNVVATFLNDEDLRSCLQQRSTWDFARADVLFAMYEKNESMFRETQTLQLSEIPELPSVINRLDLFPSLTNLCVIAPRRADATADFSAIARFCPQLKTLTLWGVQNFEGSLSSLQYVSNFALSFDTRWRSLNPSTTPFSRLLPMNSVNCLTWLRIHLPEVGRLQLDTTENPLDNFVNLKDLEIHESNPAIFELIARANISIKTLRVERDSVYRFADQAPLHEAEAGLLHLLSAPCVKRLRSLTLAGDQFYGFDFSRVWEVTPFLHLESLVLDFEVQNISGCGFERIKKLKSLHVWKFVGLENDKDYKRAKIVSELQQTFLAIFGNRPPETMVIVKDAILGNGKPNGKPESSRKVLLQGYF